jgi:hypothetical protein
MRRTLRILIAACLAVSLGAGCSTLPSDDARRHFRAGDLEQAEQTLSNIPADRDQVMHLMDRGMIRHLRSDYAGSTADWLQAVRLEDQLETHSATKAGASMVVNDTLLAFRGYPYERTYLHVFLARNYLAQGMWDDAAVEARSIIRQLERRDGFPDDAYSRYLAGLCLELTGDAGAELQYRTAASLWSGLQRIDAPTGRFVAADTNAPPPARSTGNELVCLIDLDGSGASVPDYAEIHAGGQYLGVTHTLTRVGQLERESSQQMAARRMTKQITRIAFKETLASAVASENKDLGNLLRVLLFAMEVPDERHWATLPLKLAVARLPCPRGLTQFEVVFKNASGLTLQRMSVTAPLFRQGRVFVSMCRNTPAARR